MPNYFHFLFFPHNCNCNFSFRISFKTNYQIMSLPADKLIYFAPCTQNRDSPTCIILALGGVLDLALFMPLEFLQPTQKAPLFLKAT